MRISHLILSKPGSESQGFKHSPCMFPFPVLCQCGCKAVAQPHRPSQKDTSTESAADVFPPGGVCGYSLYVQGQMGSRVRSGCASRAGRTGSPARWAELSLLIAGGDSQCGASSVHQVQPSPPADITFPWGEQGWYCMTSGSSLPHPGF